MKPNTPGGVIAFGVLCKNWFVRLRNSREFSRYHLVAPGKTQVTGFADEDASVLSVHSGVQERQIAIQMFDLPIATLSIKIKLKFIQPRDKYVCLQYAVLL